MQEEKKEWKGEVQRCNRNLEMTKAAPHTLFREREK